MWAAQHYLFDVVFNNPTQVILNALFLVHFQDTSCKRFTFYNLLIEYESTGGWVRDRFQLYMDLSTLYYIK